MLPDLNEFIKKRANALGFAKVGFAEIKPLVNQFKNFTNWINFGFNADMKFFFRNNDSRYDPSILLENSKSVVVFAYKYCANVIFPTSRIVAKYSVYRDYHIVIKEKLTLLAIELKEHWEVNSRIFVDTGAILEKQWAILAGIGWQGENGLIITKDIGSFFNIGIMLIDAELEGYSLPVAENQCGACDICIRGCPTSAIIKPKIIDASRCISYWTIENKGEKPYFIKEAILATGYIYGCDVCQNICPYNRICFSNSNKIEWKLLADIENDIDNFTETRFKEIFIESSIKRAKYSNFMNCFNIVGKNE